jgi:hypothetical protein
MKLQLHVNQLLVLEHNHFLCLILMVVKHVSANDRNVRIWLFDFHESQLQKA